jgi:hypothetical protein
MKSICHIVHFSGQFIFLSASSQQAEMAEIELAQVLFVSQLPLVWQSQGRESMLKHVHPSKFRRT